jgi:GMP synthase (glutamine-hydrolysing)
MIVLVQHDEKVPPGTFGAALEHKNIPHQLVRLYRGDPLPAARDAAGVILFGGYMGVYQNGAYPFLERSRDFIRECLLQETPLLGLCLGGQLLAQTIKARIFTGAHVEHGPLPVSLSADGRHDPLFTGIDSPFTTFQWHNDSFGLPDEAFALAFSENCPYQAFRFGNAWGLQFHPEVDEAIVADWAHRQDRKDVIQDFASQIGPFHESSLRILENFLAIVDFQ